LAGKVVLGEEPGDMMDARAFFQHMLLPLLSSSSLFSFVYLGVCHFSLSLRLSGLMEQVDQIGRIFDIPGFFYLEILQHKLGSFFLKKEF
jgi:hypothetical protein